MNDIFVIDLFRLMRSTLGLYGTLRRDMAVDVKILLAITFN